MRGRAENDDVAAWYRRDLHRRGARGMFEEAPRNRRCRALIADKSARGEKSKTTGPRPTTRAEDRPRTRTRFWPRALD